MAGRWAAIAIPSAFALASLTPCRFRFARDWGRYSSSRIQPFSPNGAAGATRGPSPTNAPALDPRPALSKPGCSLELGTWNLAIDPRLFFELCPLSFALPDQDGFSILSKCPGSPFPAGGTRSQASTYCCIAFRHFTLRTPSLPMP